MSYKSSQYKLDFKYKYKNVKKYNADECILYHSSRYYRHWGLLRQIHKEYIDEQKNVDFWSMMLDTDYPTEHHFQNETIRNQFYEFVKSGKTIEEFKPEDGSRTLYETSQVASMVAKKIAMRTSAFQDAKAAFSAWLKTRPGVETVYKVYREEVNNRIRAKKNTYEYGHIQEEIPETLDLETFATACSGKNFKLTVENSRPLKFSAGDVVRLKREFYDKRGKDPLYYSYDKELKKMDRIGTVMKKIGTNHTYGVGSREIRVMWFMHGAESAVMERCLKLVELDELPAAANGK
jgi:hypothetical protein